MSKWVRMHTNVVTMVIVGCLLGSAVFLAFSTQFSEKPPLALWIRLNKRQFNLDEPIAYSLVLENRGSQNITIIYSHAMLIQTNIFNTTSKIHQQQWLYAPIWKLEVRATIITLGPGDQFILENTWNQKTIEGKQATPGLYFIQISISEFTSEYWPTGDLTYEGKAIELKTPPTSFTILTEQGYELRK